MPCSCIIDRSVPECPNAVDRDVTGFHYCQLTAGTVIAVMARFSLLEALTPPPPFADKRDERAFQRRFLVTGLRLSRVATLVGGVLALSFWVLIAVVIENGTIANGRQLIRLIVATALFCSSFLLHAYPRFSLRNYTLVIGVPASIVCFGIGLMNVLAPDVEHQTTTRLATAITVACWLMYGFTRLPVFFVFSSCLVASLMMIYGAIHHHDEYLFALLIYLAVANLVGWAMSVGGERRERMLFSARTKLFHLTRRLAESAAASAEANASKTQVLAATSHDLRQPLASMALCVNSIEASARSRDWSRHANSVESLKSCLAVMSNSVDRISNVSSLQSEVVRIPINSVDLSAVFERLDQVFMRQAENLKIRLVIIRPGAGKSAVITNDARLWDVLANLVSNGLKYAAPDKRGWVLVRAVSLGGVLRISVVDNGIGIKKEFHARIFDEYFQIDNPARNRGRGYGLGLSIVRETLAKMPDHIIRLSSAPEKGTRFDVYVPRGQSYSNEHALVGTEMRRFEPDRDRLCESVLGGCYALVVEDDPLVRSALVDTMEGWGMLVESADSASEAIEVVRGAERLFDVVVTDFGLPGDMDGVRLIDTVRLEQGQQTPAVILSGQVPSIDSSRLRETDIRALAKPVDPGDLKAELETCIAPLHPTR